MLNMTVVNIYYKDCWRETYYALSYKKNNLRILTYLLDRSFFCTYLTFQCPDAQYQTLERLKDIIS